MGNKNFDKVRYKTLLGEASSRMTIRRGKKVNELYRVRDKIIDFVKNGDMNSALIYIDNYINEENKLKVYDVLCTMCDQMKGRVAEVENYGITDDMATNANAIVYSSHRLDIKELEKLADILKEIMPKVEFKDAINGTCKNEIVRDNVSYRK
jgi:CRISPR/Cas system CSM-associated protein Csm2 small subunit